MRALLVVLMMCCTAEVSAEELWNTYTAENGLNNNYIKAIAVDNNNVKWVIQYGATSTFDGVEWKEQSKLARRNFNNITIDHNNTVWFGVGHELYHYQDGIRTLLMHGGMDYINYIHVDESNVLWISDMGDFEYPPNIFTFDGTTFTKVLDGYLHRITIWEIAQDSNNDIWLTGSGILYKYSRADNNVHEYMLQENDRIIFPFIAIDKNDNIWVSIEHPDSKYSVIGSFQDSTWTIYDADNSLLPRGYILDVIVDQNEVLWVATDEGLVRFDGVSWDVFTTENSGLIDNRVRCLAVEENNTLWIGTESGLSKYTGDIITAVDEEPKPEALPTITTYPNPFNPSTTITFTLPTDGHASLTIYNLAGQMVRTLAEEPMNAGSHTVVWDGRDDGGNAVAAGVYVTRLTAGDVVVTGKMVLVK